MGALRGAPAEMLDWVASQLTRQAYAAGGVIIREGADDRSLYCWPRGR
jgi:hypothetical protein